MNPGYRNFPLDLSALVSRIQLVQNAARIVAVRAGTIPAGASVQIHFGSGDGIPLVNSGEWFILNEPGADEGLSWSNLAALGGQSMSLFVSYADPGGGSAFSDGWCP